MSNLGAINQNFDTLGTTTSLPTYWRTAYGIDQPAWTTATNNVGVAENSGYPTGNTMVNWGDFGGTNRAIGSLRYSSWGTDNVILRVKNLSGSIIKSFAVGYAVKQFYRGNGDGYVRFSYSTNGWSWTEVPLAGWDLLGPEFATPTGYLFDYPNTLSIPASTFSVPNLAQNADIYFRWAFSTGSSGYGIDDIWITPVSGVVAPSDFSYRSASGGIEISGYNPAAAAAVAVPSSINGLTVVGIGSTAFQGRTNITLVELPNTVRYINSSAFSGCSNLSTVTIPYGVQSIGDSAFLNCTKLAQATLPSSVTTIGGSAFQGCSALGNLILSYGLTSIGGNAFADCVSLRDVIIPGSVMHIGFQAFYNCWNLSTAWLSTGIKFLDAGAFENCYSLSEITLSSTLERIDSRAFYQCWNLPSIIIPNSVNTIGSDAFAKCYSLSTVTLGTSVQSIGDRAFEDCSGLSGVAIPSTVTSIGSRAFYGCSDLSSIIIPKNITSIRYDAFDGCAGLTNAIIPNNIGLNFSGCTNLPGVMRYAPYNTEVAIDYYYNISNNIASFSLDIPASISGLSVTHIVEGAFQGCSNLVSVTIPSGVASIESSTFRGCGSLKAVSIPSSVTKIYSYAFEGCSNLSSVTIPSGVSHIGDSAFSACNSLTSIAIPSSVAYIGYGAFGYCSGMTSISVNAANQYFSSLDGVLFDKKQQYLIQYPGGKSGTYEVPSSVTSIADRAFYHSPGLTSITIPPNVNQINFGAFDNCSSLTNAIVPDNMSFLFNNCISLQSITTYSVESSGIAITRQYGWSPSTNLTVQLPASIGGKAVTRIADNAFAGISSLRNITIPESVTSLGAGAFEGCYNLPSVTIPGSVTNVAYRAFAGCYNLATVSIPASVNSIGDMAFMGCSGLQSINIPAGVTSIGSSAFGDCFNLASASIPGSVSYLATTAFSGCYNLSSVTIPSELTSTDGWTLRSSFPDSPMLRRVTISYGGPNIVANAFAGCTGLTNITIPSSVADIGDSAFAYCSGLKAITLPAGVSAVGNSAFYGCGGLTNVTIPSSLTEIGTSAFAGCGALTNIQVLGGNPSFSSAGGVLFDKYRTALVQYPGGRQGTFTIPDGVASIRGGAFAGCSNLPSIIIPASVAAIGDFAFENSGALANILFRGAAPPNVSATAFANSSATIYYLPGATGWSGTFGGLPTQIFQPTAGTAGFTPARAFQFAWSNTANFPMNVQRSTSVAGPWTVVSSNNLTGSYADTNTPAGQAFYRAVLP